MKAKDRIEAIDRIRAVISVDANINEAELVEALMRKYVASPRDIKECLKMARNNTTQLKLPEENNDIKR